MNAAQILQLENNPAVTIKFASPVDGQPPAYATVEYGNVFADLPPGWEATPTVQEPTATGTRNHHRVWELTHRNVEGAVIAVRCETGLAILFEVAKTLQADALKALLRSLWKNWKGNVGKLPSSIVFEGVGNDSRVRANVRVVVPTPVTDNEIVVWVGRFHNRFHSILRPMEWVAPPKGTPPNYHDLVWAAAAGQVQELVDERAKFESRVAKITDAYWPHHKKLGAAVLVSCWSWRHPLQLRKQVRLERITGDVDAGDWLDVFQQIEELAVRARYALRGMSQQTAAYRLFSVASQIYRCLDVDDQEEPLNKGGQEDGNEPVRTHHTSSVMSQRTPEQRLFSLTSRIYRRSDKKTENQRHELKKIRKQQRELLSDISNFIDQAAAREAKIVYVGGMGFGIIALAMLLGLTSIAWPVSDGITDGISRNLLFGSAIAGALGAIVSVLSQIRRIRVNAEVGRGYVRLLGGARPFIGAIFGAVLYVALDSGLVAAAKLQPDAGKRFLFFLTFAFIAGFSERFARDTLTSIGAGKSQAANASAPEDADAERKSSSASRSP